MAGVAYGSTRQASLSKIENARRAEEERLRPEREAKLAAEKKRMNRGNYYVFLIYDSNTYFYFSEEQISLAKSAGVILPADFQG